MNNHNPFTRNRQVRSDTVMHLLVIVSVLMAVFAFTLPLLTTLIARAG